MPGWATARRPTKANESYRVYVRLCPKCMYTPAIEKILKDYEIMKR